MTGLDPRTQIWPVEFITELKKDGKTIISSTHNLELVQEIAERVILFGEKHTVFLPECWQKNCCKILNCCQMLSG